MTDAAARAPGGAQAVQRALDVLHCFHDNGPDLSASDLARRLSLSVSTAHRLARTLLGAEFLEQDARTSRYRLGPAVTELGLLLLPSARPASGGPRAGRSRRPHGRHRRPRPAQRTVRGDRRGRFGDPKVGLRRPLHSTALGKVLLAWATPGEGGPSSLPPLPAFTDRTIVEPAALDAELARVRSAGYAVNDGESAHGVRTLAVPVLDGAGHARFALAVRGTPSVITEARTDGFLAQARSCARALEVLLLSPGERRPPGP